MSEKPEKTKTQSETITTLRAQVTALNLALVRRKAAHKATRELLEKRSIEVRSLRAIVGRLNKEVEGAKLDKEGKPVNDTKISGRPIHTGPNSTLIDLSDLTKLGYPELKGNGYSVDNIETAISTKTDPKSHISPPSNPTARQLRHTIKELRKQLKETQKRCTYLHARVKEGPDAERAKRMDVIRKLNESIKRKRNELIILRDRVIAAGEKLDHQRRAAAFMELLTIKVMENTGIVKKLIHGLTEGCDLMSETMACPHRYSHDTVVEHINGLLCDIQDSCIRSFDTIDEDLEFWKTVWENGEVVVVKNGNGNHHHSHPSRSSRRKRQRRNITFEGRIYSYARVGYQVTNGVILLPDQEVHHKDGDSMNDDVNNWVAIDFDQHDKIHRTGSIDE